MSLKLTVLRTAAGVLLLFALSSTSPSAQEVKSLRVLLVTGGCCHDYLVIHDECFADVSDPAWTARILKPPRDGLPAVVLHCAMHSYRDGTEEWFKFLGVTSWGHGPHYPHEVLTRDATHPIMEALGPGWWNPAGGLYSIAKLRPSAHPLAAAKNQENGKEEVCVWVNDYQGTRVFGTTLGHHNETVSFDAYLDLLTRGTLWAAGKLEPGYFKKLEPRLVPLNLAKGKSASASSEQQGHPARDAFDGSTGTRWCANGDQANEWVQVDLRALEMVTALRVDWEMGDPVYRYRVESSVDGNNWTTLVDGSQNMRPGATEDSFAPREIRQLKVTFLGSSSGSWGSITELQVFGNKTALAETADLAREKEASLLTEVRVPEGLEATIFATSPAVNYPVFVAAAPDGALYVSSDKNGSIDRGARRGRVLRVRDVDDDGKADEVKMYVADVDSPRGLVWDRDRLYLLHPPHLSAFIDHDGDGIADEQKILVENIAFGFKDRPADHTSNGIELGIDGWIYCAIGDFGFMEAEGTDGRKLQLRAGGVVRVRPDGTGLELYSRGTRNILEVAVSPTLGLFARDNTNDGDGWDVRFHHFTPYSEHGYPSLYKNFASEAVKPLADYGGGSGCGAMYLAEPGFPEAYNNSIYTADWGREWVYRHRTTEKGATYSVDQHEFVRATRVTDLDVDAMSRIYVASWKGASFTYAGENVGYLVRLTPKGYKPEPLPEFESLSGEALVAQLKSQSHRRRLAAQRELIARRPGQGLLQQLADLAAMKDLSLETRVAAIFAIEQTFGKEGVTALKPMQQDKSIREFVIRALANGPSGEVEGDREAFLRGLKDENPNVRREAIFAVSRMEDTSDMEAVAGLLDDTDPVVAHTAIRASAQRKAYKPAFALLDNPRATSGSQHGALRVLQSIHEPAVVEGLIKRLQTSSDAELKRGILTALARLHFQEGTWKGDSWGTRPDTSGPYYQPAEWSETKRIASLLNEEFAWATGEDAVFLAGEFARHKLEGAEMIERLVLLADQNASIRPAVVAQLGRASKLPNSALPFLKKTAVEDQLDEGMRAQAIRALTKFDSSEALDAMLTAASKITFQQRESRDLQGARQAVLRWRFAGEHLKAIIEASERLDGAKSEWAEALLLNVADGQEMATGKRELAIRSLDDGWRQPRRQVQMLKAMALAAHRNSKDRIIEAAGSSHAEVAEAARMTAKALRMEKDLEAAKTTPIPTIQEMNIEAVLSAVEGLKGNAQEGAEIFDRQTCSSCHTTEANEPLRGPFLGNIASIYKRRELAEAILVPNKTIAQGFVTHRFGLKDEEEVDGFVVQEAADKITVRNAAAVEIIIPASDVVKRSKLEKSLMPEGLAGNLTVRELASLLDYLEGLSGEK